jgi:hypothetical protein
MLNKTIAALVLAAVVGSAAAAVAKPLSNDNGFYQDRYGLGYTNSARHDPRDTNGF